MVLTELNPESIDDGGDLVEIAVVVLAILGLELVSQSLVAALVVKLNLGVLQSLCRENNELVT